MESRTLVNGAESLKSRRIPLRYKHTRQIDKTYQATNVLPRLAQKIRVSTDAEGNPLEMIIKENIGHLNIYSPQNKFDWRVSINNERKGMSIVIQVFPNDSRRWITTWRRTKKRKKKRSNFVYTSTLSYRSHSSH
jgi:mRNA capping enzyme, beta chain